MTADLTYLTWTAVLCLILWIPYIAGTVAKYGLLSPEEYKTPLEREHPDWLRRCNRAHVNLVENSLRLLRWFWLRMSVAKPVRSP